jgi:S-methylmethionine-dependent homocysteine/selenocysteine methylase
VATRPSFPERLVTGPPLLLDAAMGSDLDRRGLATTLPLWSARGLLQQPDLVYQIHLDNLLAGADIVTTNTFRTTARTLRRAGLDPASAAELDALAVRLAKRAKAASGNEDAFIAGSMAPLEDCYLPVFETPREIAFAEHRAQAFSLKEAGVDYLMIETMPTATEAAIALQAARETGLPVTVGFVCAELEPGRPVRLLSGETLADAAEHVGDIGPAAMLLNCAAPNVIAQGLRELRQVTALPIGGYANAGRANDTTGWTPDESLTGDRHAGHARQWLDSGARIIGGCCGTHPGHTAALRQLIDSDPPAERGTFSIPG